MNSVLTFYDEEEAKKSPMDPNVHAWHVVPSGEEHNVSADIGGVGCGCGAEVNVMPHGGIVVIHKACVWH